MTRRWTAPGVLGVLAAAVTVWLARGLLLVAADGPSVDALTAGARLLVFAAGPAVLCAVPLVLVARAVLARTGPGVGVYALLGLLGGVTVGVVQTAVLLSAWPWELDGGPRVELLGLPALGGLVGGVVAGLVRRAQDARDVRGGRRAA